MKKRKLIWFIAAAAILVACEKELGIYPFNESAENKSRPVTVDQVVANLRRPLSITKDGEQTIYTYDASGRLLVEENAHSKTVLEYDRNGRVSEITITKREVQAERGPGLMESRDRIVYSYEASAAYPFKAVDYKTANGTPEYAEATVEFAFNRAGLKTMEKTVRKVNQFGSVTVNKFYYYDSSNRLARTTSYSDPDAVTTKRFVSFAGGYSAMVLVKELALIPGSEYQRGNPTLTSIARDGKQYDITDTYELNQQQQPVQIRETDEYGVVSDISIKY
jgi:YD repeat-containing protein